MKLISKLANDIRQRLGNTPLWSVLWPIRKTYRLVKKVRKIIKRKLNTSNMQKRYEEAANADALTVLQKAGRNNQSKFRKKHEKSNTYDNSGTYVLYRIIGNDLYPRHKKGQSRENLQFVLKNEPELENCEKWFVVNRIIDKDEEDAIITLLKQHKAQYLHLPFEPEEYRKIGLDTDCLPSQGYLASKEFDELTDQQKDGLMTAMYRKKNNYIMHNNGARNVALRDGKKRAKWVLPWDGNCFITQEAWSQIRKDVETSPYLKYFVVPMARMIDNAALLGKGEIPRPIEEPQLLFRSDAKEEFNEEYCYGRRPKVELFWRLGIPGNWDRWPDEPWDQKRLPESSEARQFGVAGWVARMFSGVKHLETSDKNNLKNRGLARNEAIISTIQHVDALLSGQTPNDMASYHTHQLEKEVVEYKKDNNKALTKLIKQLLDDAEVALKRRLYSVTDKTTLPPSGDKHDYWHPAPYWWPNTETKDGLPYIRKDGERVPGTEMYAPNSDKYDRSRLQRVFDDSTILMLAWKFSRESKYADHAVQILERFFVNPETRMNPHLQYSQVRMGHDDNQGNESGIMEMKDLYYYLDAVRLMKESGVLGEKTVSQFNAWLSEYLKWLLTSKQGNKERKAANNHGSYYDLQVAAIAGYLGDKSVLYGSLARAQSRIPQHFAADGSQPEELARTTTAHYCLFNLQGWINLAELSSRWGIDLWNHKDSHGGNLEGGAKWLLSYAGKKWPFEQIDEFDADRFLPLAFMVPTGALPKKAQKHLSASPYQVKPTFYPHDGIKPFWNLGL